MIFFIGTVFSPRYARARRRGAADPLDFLAVNVALYGPRGPGWCFTEHGRGSMQRGTEHLSIGGSGMRLERTAGGVALSVAIEERAAPLPRRIRGRLRVVAPAWQAAEACLDPAGLHRWMPLAAGARIEVAFDRPAWRWAGSGYVDTNYGARGLEADFVRWDWSRAALADGSGLICYDAALRGGGAWSLARRVTGGVEEPVELPPRVALPRGLWGMQGVAHGERAVLTRRLEDAPFYTRSLLQTQVQGMQAHAVHESLSLDRFSAGWVRGLLPFRMRRAR